MYRSLDAFAWSAVIVLRWFDECGIACPSAAGVGRPLPLFVTSRLRGYTEKYRTDADRATSICGFGMGPGFFGSIDS